MLKIYIFTRRHTHNMSLKITIFKRSNLIYMGISKVILCKIMNYTDCLELVSTSNTCANCDVPTNIIFLNEIFCGLWQYNWLHTYSDKIVYECMRIHNIYSTSFEKGNCQSLHVIYCCAKKLPFMTSLTRTIIEFNDSQTTTSNIKDRRIRNLNGPLPCVFAFI